MSMTKIQEVRVGAGGAATIDFASIPQIYSDLYLVFSARESSSAEIRASVLTVNGGDVTGRRLIGESNSVFSQALFIGYIPGATATANTFSNETYYIPNYTSAIAHSVSLDSVMENNSANSGLGIFAGITTSTAAVTSLSVRSNVGNLVAGSSATLYGINRTQAIGKPKAIGGNITFANGHWVHTFTGSGTFVAQEELSVDAIVVAGGGGGAHGGGGAGGYLTSASGPLQLSANQSLPVVVGAGGANGFGITVAGTSGFDSLVGSFRAIGGGRGGSVNTTGSALVGGSGGGSGGSGGFTSGAAGTSGQGFAGGNYERTANSNQMSAGGGGAGGVGSNNSGFNSGNGGPGVITSITGTQLFIAGGGGGGQVSSGTAGLGQAGGGNGSRDSTLGNPGTANTGGGGGGAGFDIAGGNGGSGVVIIRYRAD